VNTALKELTEQATVNRVFMIDESGHPLYRAEFDQELFAQLIIRKCRDLILSQDVDLAVKTQLAAVFVDYFEDKDRIAVRNEFIINAIKTDIL
jgi:sensor domain CHASE-containing protein